MYVYIYICMYINIKKLLRYSDKIFQIFQNIYIYIYIYICVCVCMYI